MHSGRFRCQRRRSRRRGRLCISSPGWPLPCSIGCVSAEHGTFLLQLAESCSIWTMTWHTL